MAFHQADCKSPKSTGGSVGYWLVRDLLKASELFVKNGAEIYRGPIVIPCFDQGTAQGICQIKDPFGNVFGLQGEYKAK